MCINKICEKMKVCNLNCSVVCYILIVVLSVSIIGFCVNDMANQQKTFFHKYETILETIQTNQAKINDPKNKKPEIINFEKESYQEFLARNYEIQSGWLNAWIMFLAIIIAVMGIAFPIFAMDKKKEIDDIIEDAKQKVDDAVANADESKKQADEAIIQANAALYQVKEAVTKVKELVNKAEASEKQAKESENQAKASAYFGMGYQSCSENKFSDGIDYYSKAIKLKPDFADAYYNRGNVKAELKKYDEAIEDYNKAIELRHDFAKAYCNRGAVKVKIQEKLEESKRDYRDAINDFDKAIELKPDDACAYYNLSEAYIFKKEFDKSLESLKMFKQKEPKPYILKDDYEKWTKGLNENLEDPNAQEILTLINSFDKKDR